MPQVPRNNSLAAHATVTNWVGCAGWNADARILHFTGSSDRLFEDRKTLLEHEAFIEKPVTVKGLLEAVSLLLFGHTHGPVAGRRSAA